MTKIAVAGCCGRMGNRICELVMEDKGLSLVSGFERKDFEGFTDNLEALREKQRILFTNSAEEAIRLADVLIEFTLPGPTLEHLKIVEKHKKKMVIGTTGFTASQLSTIKRASSKIPILMSPNMSVGVNLLFKLSETVASTLQDEYDIEIVEFHHKMKKDAPSGTAAKLAEIVAGARKVSLGKTGVYGRKGFTGERKTGSIGVHAVRGGDVVGDHTVSFLGDGERIELVHKASSRDAFAKGALLAAKFLSKKKKGLFNMHDVLGL